MPGMHPEARINIADDYYKYARNVTGNSALIQQTQPAHSLKEDFTGFSSCVPVIKQEKNETHTHI